MVSRALADLSTVQLDRSLVGKSSRGWAVNAMVTVDSLAALRDGWSAPQVSRAAAQSQVIPSGIDWPGA
jgi:hypothetical protein